MTAPTDRLGCRVLDKDGDDWGEREGGYAEWRALELANYWSSSYTSALFAPYSVTDADGVTLHTIHATTEVG